LFGLINNNGLFLDLIIEVISDVMFTHYNMLDNDDYAIATSISPEKFLAHVIKDYLVANNLEAANFTKLLFEEHLNQRLLSVIDPNVNTVLQNFRLPYCHKTGSNRTKKPIRGAFRDFIICNKTCYGNAQLLERIAPIAEGDFAAAVGNDLVAKVLEMATPFVDSNWFYIKKKNMLLFKRTNANHCQLCNKTHNSDNTAYVAVHQTMVVLHCRRSPGHILIGRLSEVQEG